MIFYLNLSSTTYIFLELSLLYHSRYLVSFINLKIFPSLVQIIGLPAMFWLHSAICILLCILAIFILPETQGKTLTELSEMYSNNSKKALDEINKITTKIVVIETKKPAPVFNSENIAPMPNLMNISRVLLRSQSQMWFEDIL